MELLYGKLGDFIFDTVNKGVSGLNDHPQESINRGGVHRFCGIGPVMLSTENLIRPE